MDYKGTVYRPPIEACTILLPVTEGCSHNACHFCNMYKDVSFRMLPTETLKGYLEEVKQRFGVYFEGYAKKQKRVYLVGADPFVLSAGRMLERIELIREYLPYAETFTMYARANNVSTKSDAELKALAEAGVDDLYLGVESGLDEVLRDLNKGYGTQEIKEQCFRLNEAGIHHCDLMMTGAAGTGRAAECARAAAELENETKPNKILVNTISAFEGTKLDDDIKAGRFVPASEREVLEEEIAFLEALDLPDCYFWAAHPLDAIRVEGMLHGEEKEEMLAELRQGISQVQDGEIRRVSRQGRL